MYKGEILVGSYFLTRQVHTPSIDKNWIRRDTLEVFVNTQKQLYEYFSGSREDFTINYKLEGNNSQLKVWSALTEIRYGRTSNYKQIAHNIKEPKAIRKVANTIGHNPLIIIVPCHRVIGSDGSLKGYSAGLGLKQVLLSMEKAKTACTSEF